MGFEIVCSNFFFVVVQIGFYANLVVCWNRTLKSGNPASYGVAHVFMYYYYLRYLGNYVLTKHVNLHLTIY